MNPSGRVFRIVEQVNPVLREQELKFGKVKTDASRLMILRREYKLDEVASGGRTEFEKILLLKRWVRSRWDHGWENTPLEPPADGLVILRHADRGESFTCGNYAQVLYDCCRSFGYQARRLGITIKDSEFPEGPRKGNIGHSITEVWSNEHRKWVVMDADKNCHYEKDGVPLGALEIRKAWLQGEEEKVELVLDNPKFVIPTKPPPNFPEWTREEMERQLRIFSSHKTMPYYHYVEIHGNSLGMPALRWTDECSPLQLVRNHEPLPQNAVYTDQEADFNWRINQTNIRLGCESINGVLRVTLTHSMPDFKEFQVRIDDGPWKGSEPSFKWGLNPGINKISCKAVNRFGVEGPESYVRVEYR